MPGLGNEELGGRADQEDCQVDDEHGLAPDFVGKVTADGSTEENADQSGGADQALPHGGEP